VDFDTLVTVAEALAGGPVPKVARPVLAAQERGVVGWCVDRSSCLEVQAATVTPLNLQDVPVPVALVAWREDRLDFEDLLVVLAAHDQVMKPGDERVVDDEDGHFYFTCWCGLEGELSLTEEAATSELWSHTEGHCDY
jgi:hypothetical protein